MFSLQSKARINTQWKIANKMRLKIKNKMLSFELYVELGWFWDKSIKMIIIQKRIFDYQSSVSRNYQTKTDVSEFFYENHRISDKWTSQYHFGLMVEHGNFIFHHNLAFFAVISDKSHWNRIVDLILQRRIVWMVVLMFIKRLKLHRIHDTNLKRALNASIQNLYTRAATLWTVCVCCILVDTL